MKVNVSILTVSDTRSLADDFSGQLIFELLTKKNFNPSRHIIVKDDCAAITHGVGSLVANSDAIILNGGTGIAKRDVTFEAITPLLVQEIPGFGELFRYLSFKEIGSHALASRALAGFTQDDTLLFCLPGSTKACQLGMEKLILPELVHLLKERRK
ncbi:molybdenum cofactor biosynthesis protein MoaB [Enterococcus sp. MJM12]|uniref:Molybdenum cofactor biosynthesis protein B n=1 Tax=Candidatus Enterococcus myersii TaxID=2815322 RepID=A0ABS3HAC8_9ENTE|nr:MULTISPECIES: molybdenum cofactor biosynthesis protein B [Enterococcus]MBO0450411.1 molybdenum cofactor biosynthesis protein MoaB [Enterococcus sp. MJM12]MCD1024071.1 molybdenum cofactor biosynthesis protein MoaB [Enterococcus sp. SMC-9]WHA09949.1 molybdenum cofactor biosynthesis protein MoaB [Enterococcus montenegrensis]